MLQEMQARGLEIVFVEGDLRSHKKYYYCLQRYPHDIVVTIDDDIIYPTFMLERLIEFSNRYRGSIVCHRAKRLGQKGGKLAAYSQWNELVAAAEPAFDVFFTTGGGTLFPPNALYKDVLAKEIFTTLSFSADDVWLNCMSRLQSTPVAKTDYYSTCLPVMHRTQMNLSTINLNNRANDAQIAVLRNHYRQKLNRDPFADFSTSG